MNRDHVAGIVIGGSIAGICALCYRGLSAARATDLQNAKVIGISEADTTKDRRSKSSLTEEDERELQQAIAQRRTLPLASDVLRPQVRRRLGWTYGYFASSVALTAGMGALLFKAGAAEQLIQTSQTLLGRIAVAGCSLLVSFGSIIGMIVIPKRRYVLRHLAYAGFILPMALGASVLGFFKPALVAKAGLMTSAVVASLSAVVAVSPTKTFLKWEGALAAGFGALAAISLGQLLFPSTMLLADLQLYGGLLVFSGALLFDTAEVIETAEVTPARDPATGEDPYDPMVQSLNVYLDSMSIFWRIFDILAGKESGRRK